MKIKTTPSSKYNGARQEDARRSCFHSYFHTTFISPFRFTGTGLCF